MVALLRVCSTGDSRSSIAVRTNVEATTLLPAKMEVEYQLAANEPVGLRQNARNC